MSVKFQNHTIKHNIIDRDKILIPGPGWDSWGKIRVLGEAFDVEGICSGWSRDISSEFTTIYDDVDGSAVEVYEDVIKDSMREGDSLAALKKPRGIEVQPVDTQEFLAMQMESLETRSGVGDAQGKDRSGLGSGSSTGVDSERGHGRTTSKTLMLTDGAVRDHVGPVQFNVGGIQMDADDMVKNIKVCHPNTAFMYILVREWRILLTEHFGYLDTRSIPCTRCRLPNPTRLVA